jgi:hypothetical protein
MRHHSGSFSGLSQSTTEVIGADQIATKTPSSLSISQELRRTPVTPIIPH